MARNCLDKEQRFALDPFVSLLSHNEPPVLPEVAPYIKKKKDLWQHAMGIIISIERDGGKTIWLYSLVTTTFFFYILIFYYYYIQKEHKRFSAIPLHMILQRIFCDIEPLE